MYCQLFFATLLLGVFINGQVSPAPADSKVPDLTAVNNLVNDSVAVAESTQDTAKKMVQDIFDWSSNMYALLTNQLSKFFKSSTDQNGIPLNDNDPSVNIHVPDHVPF